MLTAIQLLMNGLTMGSIYAVLAICTTLIYKSMGLMDFARGEAVMLMSYICLTIYNMTSHLYTAILITLIFAVLFGFFLERFIYRKLDYSAVATLLIATMGMQIILRNLAQIIWGSMPRSFPNLFDTKPVMLGKLLILPQNIGIILTCIIMIVFLQIFFKFTRIGKKMTAAAADKEAASMLGINVSYTRFLTFGISSFFAAIAGILISPMFNVYPTMGGTVGQKAFAAAIIGGFGNIPGALVGGLILGIIEALGAGYISSGLKDAYSFILMILILCFKPTGLFSKHVEQKF